MQVVPRYALLTTIRGYNANIGSNVVEAAAHSLREKLGPRTSMIETAAGVSDRFHEGPTTDGNQTL